ncbi:MAG: TIGR04255 family protein [Proteobacteria bacterium]|nr:MAG: TIGR04255 family protein [Pseudomonadota bacterium]
MTYSISDIFTKTTKEVHLTNAPLVRVIAQVKFPIVSSIEDTKFIGGFQEALRSKYPILRKEHSTVFTIHIGDQPSGQQETVWRFTDKEDNWRVSLSPSFLAIEAMKYTNRQDFFNRFKEILIALKEWVDPVFCERIGVRFIDRISGSHYKNIRNLIKPEILGLSSFDDDQFFMQNFTQSFFSINQADRFSARYGSLPQDQTYDPSAVDPLKEKSWILDLDMFSEERLDLDPEIIYRKSLLFADNIYSFFRWTVTEEFLKAYGGTIQ